MTRHWPPAILRQHTPDRNILFAGNHRRIIISHTKVQQPSRCTTTFVPPHPESNALHQINSQVPHPVQPEVICLKQHTIPQCKTRSSTITQLAAMGIADKQPGDLITGRPTRIPRNIYSDKMQHTKHQRPNRTSGRCIPTDAILSKSTPSSSPLASSLRKMQYARPHCKQHLREQCRGMSAATIFIQHCTGTYNHSAKKTTV
ncbi:hypothetical protein Nepgr_018759 [Nepenthes gracilis]|uniref:Uncharacterized protein n=1 Tax=Nepenthes gracilis TaxID=150966 RepID=A0AAD3XTR6_NEPGR|nr:hypothetical protein Nepgr_018759 [Nepenthes gracilis]